ncbi:MAG: hypothetical protein VX745_10805 [Pseudomonadota bacterium]|nr:hypothetical protein [Pseudomonadota bacterium]
MTLATDQMNKWGVDTLLMSPYFYDAAFLPSILIPGKRTVQYLR